MKGVDMEIPSKLVVVAALLSPLASSALVGYISVFLEYSGPHELGASQLFLTSLQVRSQRSRKLRMTA
jgi:hypothetical protein